MSLNIDQMKFKLPFILAVLAITTFPAYALDLCKEGKKGLIGDYDVLQASGGMWGYMEKISDLKDKSTMGLTADGKLQRAIVVFEDMCNSEKKPDQAMYDKIQNQLTKAAALLRNPPGRLPSADVLKAVEGINTGME